MDRESFPVPDHSAVTAASEPILEDCTGPVVFNGFTGIKQYLLRFALALVNQQFDMSPGDAQ